MAIAYKSAGAGASQNASATALNLPCPATVDAGDILIAHVVHVNNTTAPTTPGGGWELLFGPSALGTGTPTARAWAFGKIADGTEDGANVSFGTAGGTSGRFGRIYSFSGRTSGTILQLAPSASFAENASETDPVIQAVTTTVAGAKAVALVSQDDDNAHDALGAVTGGTWAEPVADYLPNATAVPSQGGSMQLQVGTPTSDPGTINGGTVAGTNDEANTICFQILPAPPVTTKTINPAAEADSGGALVYNATFVTIDPAAETDLVGDIVAFQPFPAAETDQARPLDYHLARPPVDLVPAVTTDDGQPLGKDKHATVDLASEADSAQPVSYTQASTYTIAAASETDDGQPLTFTKTIRKTAGVVSETDDAQTVAFTKTILKTLGVVAEADAAQTVSYAQAGTFAITPALETDTAEAADADKHVTITEASELADANTILALAALTASETDTAVALVVEFGDTINVDITPALETSDAQTVDKDKHVTLRAFVATPPLPYNTIPAVGETDTAAALTVTHEGANEVTVAQALETDAAQAADVDKHAALAVAAEADSAETLVATKTIHKTVTLVGETDTAQGLTYSQAGSYTIARANETDLAVAVTFTKTIHKTLTVASESDTSVPLTAGQFHSITPALETNVGTQLTSSSTVSVAFAVETDAARTVTVVKPLHKTIGPASETDAARFIGVGGVFAFTHAATTDVAVTLVYGHLQPAGTVGGTHTGRLGRIHVGRVTKPRQGVLV